MTFSFGAPAQPAATGGFGAASTGFGGASTASAFGKPATTQSTGIRLVLLRRYKLWILF